MAARTRAATPPAPEMIEAAVHRAMTRIGATSTRSRSMTSGFAGTPYDALKPSAKMPVVGSVGPASATAFIPPIMRYARHIDRNEGFPRHGMDLRADAVVGTGPWPKFRFDELNTLFERHMKESDARGQANFGQQIRKAYRTQCVDGEVFFQIIDEPTDAGLQVPLSLMALEADHFDPSINRVNSDNGNRIVSAIELSGRRRAAYWMYTNHPEDMGVFGQWGAPIRVPAADILHLYEGERPSSLRGISMLAPAIIRTIKTAQYENAELVRKISATLHVGYAKLTDKSAAPARMPGETDLDDWVSEIVMEAGAFNVLPFGVEPVFNNPPDTGTSYRPYMQFAGMYLAACLGMMYQELYGDWSDASDRTHKAASLSVTRMIMRDRDRIEHQTLSPYAKRFVDRAYLCGAWSPPKGVPQNEWYDGEWGWPAIRYQNLFQEFNAYALAIEENLMDTDTAAGELFGLDARAVARRQSESIARRRELGVLSNKKELQPGGAAAAAVTARVLAQEAEEQVKLDKSDDDSSVLERA